MKLQDFSGGQNTRQAPHLLGVNEAVTYENVENAATILKPINKLSAAGSTLTDTDRYIKSSDSIVTLASVPTSFVDYKDDIYYSVAGGFPQVKAATSEGDLGLDEPVITEITTTVATLTAPVAADITVTDYTADGTHVRWFQSAQTYDFAITEVDSSGRESPAYEFSYSPTINLTAIQMVVNNGKTLRLYMLHNGTWMSLVQYAGLAEYTGPNSELILADYMYKVNLTGTHQFYWPAQAFVQYNHQRRGMLIQQHALYDTVGDFKNLDFDPTTISATASGFPAATYSYVAVLESVALGWRSAPSTPAAVTMFINYFISLTIDEIATDARVDKLTVYRIGNTLTDFTVVHAAENPTFPYTFTDDVSDETAAGNTTLSEEEDFDKTSQNLENLLMANNQLCGSTGSRLYFSLRGKPFAMPPSYYRDFDEDIVGLYNIDAGLLVCSATKTWLINTSNLLVGKKIVLSAEFGSLSHQAMVGWGTGCMWASEKGIVASLGGKVELITKRHLGYVNLAITHAYMFNESYFGFTAQGACYVVDMRYGGPIVKQFAFTAFTDADSNTIVRQVYEDDGELKILFGTTSATDSYTLFGGTEKETLTWLSPEFIEGSLTELKTYNNIYVRATADLTFYVYLDGELVQTTSFYEEATYDITVPQEEQQAYKIQFKAIGTGELHEIEYKTMGRKNGR